MTKKELKTIFNLAEAFVKTLPDETISEISAKSKYYEIVDSFYNEYIEHIDQNTDINKK